MNDSAFFLAGIGESVIKRFSPISSSWPMYSAQLPGRTLGRTLPSLCCPILRGIHAIERMFQFIQYLVCWTSRSGILNRSNSGGKIATKLLDRHRRCMTGRTPLETDLYQKLQTAEQKETSNDSGREKAECKMNIKN